MTIHIVDTWLNSVELSTIYFCLQAMEFWEAFNILLLGLVLDHLQLPLLVVHTISFTTLNTLNIPYTGFYMMSVNGNFALKGQQFCWDAEQCWVNAA
jgi:hypothetical protein